MAADNLFINSHKYIRMNSKPSTYYKCRISVYDLRDLDNRRQIDMYDLCNAKTYYTRFRV